MKEQIDQLQLQYEIKYNYGKRHAGEREGLCSLMEAAAIQYQLSKLTTGESSARHQEECLQLIATVEAAAVQLGITLDPVAGLPVEIAPTAPAQAPATQTTPVQTNTTPPAATTTTTTTAKPAAPAKPAAGNKKDDLSISADTFLLTQIPDVTFADLIEINDSIKAFIEALTKRSLRERYVNLFPQIDTSWPNALVYGPPGTGKTFLFKALANYVMTNIPGAKVYQLTGSKLLNRYVGVAEERLTDMFAEMENNEFTMLCIDEIDALVPSRSNDLPHHSETLVATFLQLLDGLSGKPNLLIVGAANYPWKLDSAMLRRLDQTVMLDLPADSVRREYIQRNIASKFFGTDPQVAEQLIQQAVNGTQRANFSNLDQLHRSISELCIDKTITSHPNNFAVAVFDPITSEELAKLLDRLEIIYDEDHARRLAEFGKGRKRP